MKVIPWHKTLNVWLNPFHIIYGNAEHTDYGALFNKQKDRLPTVLRNFEAVGYGFTIVLDRSVLG